MRTRLSSISVALCLSFALISPAVLSAASLVNVMLEDSTTGPATGNMRISVDHDTVKAGRVTFRAVNQSKELIHEMIVIKVDPKRVALPYDEKTGKVVETRVKRLGEISELKPGASGTTALNLGTGSYVLICNQPGHFKAGMVANLTVKN
jgi:uncharacterized cupredoxin-like copper-binding protein